MKILSKFIIFFFTLNSFAQNTAISDAVRVYFSEKGVSYFEKNLLDVVTENIGVDPSYYEETNFQTKFHISNIYKIGTPKANSTLDEVKNKMLNKLNRRFLGLMDKQPTIVNIDQMVFQAQWDNASLKAFSNFNKSYTFPKEKYLFSLSAIVEASNLNFEMSGLKLKNKYLSIYDKNSLNIFTNLDSTPLKFKVEIGFYKEDGVYKVQVLDPFLNIADILLNLNYTNNVPLELILPDIKVTIDNDEIWLYKNGAVLDTDDWNTAQAKKDTQELRDQLLVFLPKKIEEYLVTQYPNTVSAIKKSIQETFDESAQKMIQKNINDVLFDGYSDSSLMQPPGSAVGFMTHDCSQKVPRIDEGTGEYILDSAGKIQFFEARTTLTDPERLEKISETALSQKDFENQTDDFKTYSSYLYDEIFLQMNDPEFANYFNDQKKLQLVCGFEWEISLSDLGTQNSSFYIGFDGKTDDTSEEYVPSQLEVPFKGQGFADYNKSLIEDYDISLSFDIEFFNRIIEMSYNREYFKVFPISDNEEDGFVNINQSPKLYVNQDGKLMMTLHISYPRNNVDMGGLKKFLMKTFLIKDWILLEMNVGATFALNDDGTYRLELSELEEDSVKADKKAYKLFGKIFRGTLAPTIKKEVIKVMEKMKGKILSPQIPIPSELGIISLKHKKMSVDRAGRLMFYTEL